MNRPIPPLPSEAKPSPLETFRFQRLFRAFPVSFPVTVFVRASQCQVVVHYHHLDQVELHASLYAAFGMKLVIERDEAGIYIIARRKRVLGAFSRSEFTMVVPDYCHLAFNLTPGHIRLVGIDGTLQIPPPRAGNKVEYQIDQARFKALPSTEIGLIQDRSSD
jgi:hypothetical protein